MTLAEEHAYARFQEGGRSRASRLARTGIQEKYWDADWDDLLEINGGRAFRELREWTEDWIANGVPELGFYFEGSVGVGKTMASSIAGVKLSDARNIVRFVRLDRLGELLVRQISLSKAWQAYDATAAYEEWETNDLYLHVIRNHAELVIFDDVGQEHSTSTNYVRDAFTSLVRHRGGTPKRVTCMTSNILLNDWADRYGAAMQSFVAEIAVKLGLDDDHDLRGHPDAYRPRRREATT